MDTSPFSSLVWIVIWGGFFFLMMRHGCGAHLGGHGHLGGTGNPGHAAGDSSAKDPVCGMNVNPRKAGATTVHLGEIYYFCSYSCRDTFEQMPAKYTGKAPPADHPQVEHHHG